MRVVVLSAQTGAGDIRARKACRWALEAGHEVILIAGHDDTKDPHYMLHLLPEDEWLWTGPGEAKPKTFVMAGRAPTPWLLPAIASLKPDVVHVHGLDVLDRMAWKWAEKGARILYGGGTYRDAFETGQANLHDPPFKVVYDAHEYEADRPLQWSPLRGTIDRGWRERLLATGGFADAVITVSPALVRCLQFELGRPTFLVPNSPFAPSYNPREMRDAMRTRIFDEYKPKGWKPTDPLVIHVGYAVATRRLDALCGAVKRSRDPALRLLQLGKWDFDGAIMNALGTAGAALMEPLPYPFPEHGRTQGSMLDAIVAADVAFCGAELQWASWKMQAPNKWWEAAFAGVRQVASGAEDIIGWMAEADGQLGRIWDGDVRTLGQALVEEAAAGRVPHELRADFAHRWCYSRAGYQGNAAAYRAAMKEA